MIVLTTSISMTEKKGKKTKIDIFHLRSHNFYRLGSNKGITRLKKQSEYNESSFHFLIRSQNI